MSGWYPDPTGRFEYRFHNDQGWTADVSTGGRRSVDPLNTSSTPPAQREPEQRVGGRRDGLRDRRRRHRLDPVRGRARPDHRHRRPGAVHPCAGPITSVGPARLRHRRDRHQRDRHPSRRPRHRAHRRRGPGPRPLRQPWTGRRAHRGVCRRRAAARVPRSWSRTSAPRSARTRSRSTSAATRPSGSRSTTCRAGEERSALVIGSTFTSEPTCRIVSVNGPVPFGLDPDTFDSND